MSVHEGDSVVDCLRRAARVAPGNGVTAYGRAGDAGSATYPELLRRAERFAAGLRRRGLGPGRRVGLFLPSSVEFFVAYFGALRARVVPVVMPTPAFGRRLSLREAQRFEVIAREAGLVGVVDGAGLDATERLAPGQGRYAFAEIEAGGEAAGAAGELEPERADDPALIQYTSGSVASPSGVVLSERNISINVQWIAELVGMNPRDTIDLWIPLFHDMGLMGSLTTVASGANLRICSPSVFLADPLGWLLRFSAKGSTINPSPNFFFRMLVDDYDAKRAAALDLRPWRVAFNGAELVRAEDLERFQAAYGPHGFAPETMFPVYGMAETTLALTFPTYGAPPRVVRGDEALSAAAPAPLRRRRYVSVGRALPGHEIALRRPAGAGPELPPEVGEIMARGPSVMQGYAVSAAPELRRPFVEGWLPTRDLGFLHGGELFVCGRLDEVIIVRGANYFPEDVESLAERTGALGDAEIFAKAAFRLQAPPDGEGEVALAVEIKADPASLPARLRRLEGDLLRELGFPVRAIAMAPRSMPRTTSGKLKRLALSVMIARGELDEKILAWGAGPATPPAPTPGEPPAPPASGEPPAPPPAPGDGEPPAL